METIVNMRKWQRTLVLLNENQQKRKGDKNSFTRMQTWLAQCQQDCLSLLPIYLDRVEAFSGPLYGVDTTALFSAASARNHPATNTNRQPSMNDWDALVLEFLRKQDKLGGPPTAVALVLDALATGNWHVERGFRLTELEYDDSNDNKKSDGNEDRVESGNPLVLWPAVYLRSTTYLNSATASRSAGATHGSGLLRKSGSSSSQSAWAADLRSSPRSKTGRKTTDQKWNVMEYAPDTGKATSFPHSDWEVLMSLLQSDTSAANATLTPTRTGRLSEETLAVTYRDDDENQKLSPDSPEDSFRLVNVAVSEPSSSSPSAPPGPPKLPSSAFHVISVSEYLSLVVIVKGEEDSRWLRRRSALPDEEIRSFLNDMAQKLRVSSQFTMTRLPPVNKTPSGRLQVSEQATWDDDQLQDFLSSLKESFGLRPNSPWQDGLRSYNQFRKPQQSPNLSAAYDSRRRRQSKAPSFGASATALFLGPDLASLWGGE
jgi:hypothetical protein